MLLDRLCDPVDLGVPSDSLVEGVNEDHLKVLVGRVLTNPIGAKDTQSLDTSSNTFFSNALEVPDGLHLVDLTGSLGLTKGASLGNWAFASTSSHGNAIDDIA